MNSEGFNAALETSLEMIQEQDLSVEDCLERFPEYRKELIRLLPIALQLGRGRSLSASEELRTSIARRLSHQTSGSFLVTNLAALRSMFRSRNTNYQRRAYMIPALVTFLIVAALSMGGLVVGADAAGPGDILFGLDTAIEDVRLSFTRDDEHEAELRMEFATERLEELHFEIEGEGDRHHIEEALVRFEEALAAIEGLLGELNPEQRAAFEEALALLIASAPTLGEFEFEFEHEDGRGELKLEIESDDDLDDQDHCDTSAPGSSDCSDDDDLDHEDEDCDSSDPGDSDCTDDSDDDCDSSKSGSDDCLEHDSDDDAEDDSDDDCDSSGPGADCSDSDDSDDLESEDEEDGEDEEDEEEDES